MRKKKLIRNMKIVRRVLCLIFVLFSNVLAQNPQPGDPCDECPGLRCPCRLCPDGVNSWGCCGECTLNAGLQCTGFKPRRDCPDEDDEETPKPGDPCDDCVLLQCPCEICPDGLNTRGCCGACVFDADLECVYEGTGPDSICPEEDPREDQPGDPCSACIVPLCPCELCPDGVNSEGCCGGCVLDKDLQCVNEGNSVCPAEEEDLPKPGDACDTCLKLLCPCTLCPDGINSEGCCGDCVVNDDLECVYEGRSVCPDKEDPNDNPCVPTCETCPGGYNDGCNVCSCDSSTGFALCTLRFCGEQLDNAPFCTPDCSAVSCFEPTCSSDEILITPAGDCCPVCVQDLPCELVLCDVPETCAFDQVLVTKPGQCCPVCETCSL